MGIVMKTLTELPKAGSAGVHTSLEKCDLLQIITGSEFALHKEGSSIEGG